MNRISSLKQAVQNAQPGVCTDRALIWTRYFKKRENRKKQPCIQTAEALRDVLLQKSILIYPDELIVGNASSKRVGGSIYPELHGIVVMQDLFKFNGRRTNPLDISYREIWELLKIIPFWFFRFLGFKAYDSPWDKLRFIYDQLNARYYFINESGGVAHLAPDYEKLVNMGTENIISEVERFQNGMPKHTDSWWFYESVKIIAGALGEFGNRYGELARLMAGKESDEDRRKELLHIADVCQTVPKKGAETFHEALQSIFFAQIAINLESLDNAISPGRMDAYLYPYYERDLQKGILTRDRAKELIASFSVKMSEIIPVFSERITRFHGGMFNGQVVTVGGVNREGKNGSNELSNIFLEVMDELRMRQPNYHARIHQDAPPDYLDRIYKILSNGSNSPALYNDDVIVKTLVQNGYELCDARDYTAVGCVEPVCQGKSFSSTDAALFNLPIMLELALNQGKRFDSIFRTGVKTKPVSMMESMDDVKEAFERQLVNGMNRLIKDLKAVESANAKYHPTPLTSMLLNGCLEKGVCSTSGGAAYNFSGIQCVGPADTGDALYAIERAVFKDKKLDLPKLVDLLKENLSDERWLTYLQGLEKFGNDDEHADSYTGYVLAAFNRALEGRLNSRGGPYTTGLYSVTAHEYFGTVTGALPNGRRKGESFASGISPSNGRDRKGPTAMLNSVNRIDATQFANGVNLNVKFSQEIFKGEHGSELLKNLFKTYFNRGGMQAQFNVIDPNVLIEARDNPNAYPYLLVRVSGYSAYFNDLTRHMQDEIISRTCATSL
jgi:formate C-acetyltransferase